MQRTVTSRGCAPWWCEPRRNRCLTLALATSTRTIGGEATMKSVLLYFLGVPIVVIVLLNLFGVL